MAHEPDSVSLAYQPTGFCPKCDYHTDPGVCPECGYVIPLNRLRRRPQNWVRRHVWITLGLLTIVTVSAWWGLSRPELNRRLPTFWLLMRQGGSGPKADAAADELARRFVAGQLVPEQLERFVRQFGKLEWMEFRASDLPGCSDVHFPGSYYFSTYRRRSLAVPTNLPILELYEGVTGLRLDGQAVTMIAVEPLPRLRESSGPYGGWSPRSLIHLAPFGMTNLGRGSSSHPDRASAVVIQGISAGDHAVEIDTVVSVSVLPSGGPVARWYETHRIQIEVHPSSAAPWFKNLSASTASPVKP